LDSKHLFDRLVANALDFLAKSVADLEKQPKYSTVHFYTAVELFVKARLMAEHWSLVVSRRHEPDWDDFLAGEFHSVSLDEAAVRLKKVVRSGLSDQELKAFQRVGRHRNKALHFFHEAHSAQENEALRSGIAKEQLTAWYFLHRVLTTRWEGTFAAWSGGISELDKRLREHHMFLQIVFDQKRPDIEVLSGRGVRFEECPSCGFISQQHRPTEGDLYESQCLVCGLAEQCIELPCPECRENVLFRGEGFATCPSCERYIEPKDLADELTSTREKRIAEEEGGQYLANCGDCDGYHTVLPRHGVYFCTSCFGTFDSIRPCEWCCEPNTGDMAGSYAAGCSHCYGRFG
jgi:hypothetical protein